MFKVKYNRKDEIPKEQLSNIFGTEHVSDYNTFLIVSHYGRIILFESDEMEPEDARFVRGFHWVKEAIEQAYKCGY